MVPKSMTSVVYVMLGLMLQLLTLLGRKAGSSGMKLSEQLGG